MSDSLRIDKIVDSISITHKFDKDKLIFLNTSDVYNGEIINKEWYEVSSLKGQAKKTIENGDILFSEIRPKNKHFAMVNVENPEDYVVSTKLMVLRKFNDDVDLKYFYYNLINDEMLAILQSRAENRICSFPQITFELLSEYKIRVPKKDEQIKIANVLTYIDEKIRVDNEICSKLEQIIEYIYEYWFVQFDFPNSKGKPYKKNEGVMEEDKGELRPISFKRVALNKLTPLSNEKITPQEGIVYHHYSIPVFDEKGTYGIELGETIKSDKSKVKEGQILVSKLNPWFSRVILPENTTNTIASTEFVVWDVKDRNTRNFLYAIAINPHFRDYCATKSTGTSNSHKRIDPEVMMQYEVFANEDIIQEFGKKIDGFVSEIERKKQEIYQLKGLKDFLLPLLMNGQVTFKD